MSFFNRFFKTSKGRSNLLSLAGNEEDKFNEFMSDIKTNADFLSMNEYFQHGDTTCLTHSIAVAYYSFAFIKKFRICCDERSLVRGALLHDYFLYDWHVAQDGNNWHGFTHPKKALFNASKEFELNQIEADIIKRHMFPLTPSLPKYKESAIVCLIDKFCSIFEIFKTSPYTFVRYKYVHTVQGI